jgi:hypothetical protein
MNGTWMLVQRRDMISRSSERRQASVKAITKFYSISLLAVISLIPEIVDSPFLADTSGFYQNVCNGEYVTVRVESILYEADVSDNFFVQFHIVSTADRDIYVDFRDYWSLIRPVQYVSSAEEELLVIDICTPVAPELTGEFSAEVLGALDRGELTLVPAGESLEFYVDFNAGGREDIDSLTERYLFVGYGGWLTFTDGSVVEVIAPDGDFIHIRTDLPAMWDKVPHGSIIAYDDVLGVIVEEY